MVTFLSLLADMIEKRHRDEQQRVFLHRLVRSKNRADVETALKAATKETIEREDGEGRTPLMVAVLERQAEIAHLLLQHGADPNHTDRLRNTPLMLAAEQEDLKIAEILLKGSDLTASNASGCTVAHVLARNSRNAKGAHKLLKMLLQGLPLSEFERKDEHGCTPLFVACTTPAPSLDNIQLLIKGKCSIDPVNRDGRTPLLVAAAVGHAHVVKLLLEAGANAEHRDSTGRSVMQHAKPDSTVAAVVKAFLRERPGGERVLRHLVDEEWQVVPTLNDLPRSQRRLVSDLPDDVLTAHWPLVLNAINFQEKTRFVPNENEAQKVPSYLRHVIVSDCVNVCMCRLLLTLPSVARRHKRRCRRRRHSRCPRTTLRPASSPPATRTSCSSTCRVRARGASARCSTHTWAAARRSVRWR